MKNVLVTGGCGFVGSNLVRRLVGMGMNVTVMDDMFTGSKDNLLGIDCEILTCSVTEYSTVRRIVSKIDTIFHLAARNIIASTKNPIDDCRVNINGTLNVLMAARLNGAKVIYTSSASVYGNPKYLPINEDDHIDLLTPYAVSKYSGEGYCMAFHESYSLPVSVLRLSNVYGFGQSPSNPYCGVVAKFLDTCYKDLPVVIHGDGLSTRDFTFVEDVIDALILAENSDRAIGEVFNVATGIETSINDLAKYIIDITEKNCEPIHVDRRDIDNIRRRVLNIEKIRRKIGWIPKYTLKEGLQVTAVNYTIW